MCSFSAFAAKARKCQITTETSSTELRSDGDEFYVGEHFGKVKFFKNADETMLSYDDKNGVSYFMYLQKGTKIHISDTDTHADLGKIECD